RPQEDLPALAVPRSHPGLSFLVPEPEDLEDLYSRYKKLQQELEFLEVQEEYIKDEQKNLKKEFLHAQEEVKRIQSIPLVIGQFLEAVDQNTAIVGSTTGDTAVARGWHEGGTGTEAGVGLEGWRRGGEPSGAAVRDVGTVAEAQLRNSGVGWRQRGTRSGGDTPRGVLMYGPPGCGKTMLAKAVAHHTTAAFIRVVGSEFVQKYLGEGPRMVRDVFRLAKENAPAIIFIDEIDAIATKRFDAQTGADREVQRILLELLNQMDGFDQNVNVKVRPQRPLGVPNVPWGLLGSGPVSTWMGDPNSSVTLWGPHIPPIFGGHGDTVTLCHVATQGGMLAVRENRYIVLAKDFEKAYKTVIKKDEQEHEFYK
ncbi:PRS6B protein, partial [Alectura lathami]|nr:PRS6B protein [Alectura lathami]